MTDRECYERLKLRYNWYLRQWYRASVKGNLPDDRLFSCAAIQIVETIRDLGQKLGEPMYMPGMEIWVGYHRPGISA